MDSSSTINQFTLPQSIEAEKEVLGAIFLDPEVLVDVLEILKQNDFYLQRHQILFGCLVDMMGKDIPIDSVTVIDYMQKNKKLDVVGGEQEILTISSTSFASANVKYHAQIVKKKALVRQLIEAGNEILKDCYEEQKEPIELVDLAESRIFKIGQKQTSENFVLMKDALEESFKILDRLSSEDISGVPSGFQDLDTLTGGFQKTDLIIVAGRPSMGKTALVISLLGNAAVKHQKTVAFFSLEMGKDQLVQRFLCREARVNLKSIRHGNLTTNSRQKLMNSAGQLENVKVFIDDSAELTPIQIRTKCRRLAQKYPLDLIVVDYLQLMQVAGRAENRVQEIAVISRSLKILAKEMNVPVIALSQLSRAVESRADGRPILSDLRESGAIEQDADIVMFIHRKEAEASLIVAKHRNGPTGDIMLTFEKEYASFANYTSREEYPL